jgi:integrase
MCGEMRKKPKGQRYRNLIARRGAIYYERLWNGRRYCFSTRTADWDQAAAVRDLYEERKGIGKTLFFVGQIPKFGEFAQRYLEEDTAHLASTTRKDRRSYLREDGPLLGFFGQRKLNDIFPALLREWWNQEVIVAGRSTRTGRAYLDVLSSVLAYAIDLEIIETNPVPSFRETLRRRSNTKRGRAEAVSGRHVRPIERSEEITRLIEAAREEGLAAQALVLLLLDAGLRLGEALGLRWGKITWGTDEDDLSRALLIDEARLRGGEAGPPKSGRARSVALSRRLRGTLATLYRDRFEPSPAALILEGIDPDNFRHREWRRILKRA